MKVMFKCLWKNCEKVLSTSSGIQRHIRTVHLGWVAIIKGKLRTDSTQLLSPGFQWLINMLFWITSCCILHIRCSVNVYKRLIWNQNSLGSSVTCCLAVCVTHPATSFVPAGPQHAYTRPHTHTCSRQYDNAYDSLMISIVTLTVCLKVHFYLYPMFLCFNLESVM